MPRFSNVPIRRKILLSMLVFSILPILLVVTVALRITYKTMRDQLIYDRRMSSGWLQDRLALELSDYTGRFYQFEVDKTIKNDIGAWCGRGEPLSYSAQWDLISRMNAIISMDSSMDAIEVYNLAQQQVLVARRSGASLQPTGSALDFWYARSADMQTNAAFFTDADGELLICHQMNRFEDNQPLALIVFHVRPYGWERIIDNIRTSASESVLVYSEQGQLLSADYGTGWNFSGEEAVAVLQRLEASGESETLTNGDFCFYRAVGSGKLRILMVVPNSTLIAALYPTVFSGIGVALVAVVACVLCSILYSRAISRPIQSLSAEMQTLTLDRYSGASHPVRRDEIGVLQESFQTMIARNQELIAHEYQSQIEKRNAQLRALQAQINPHFLYNTLQVIGGMSLRKKAPEIYSVTVALSDILRYSLNFEQEMVCLSEEISYLQSYIAIQNERFDNRIRLTLSLAPETLAMRIPKLILQPIVENSFEHGLVDKSGPWCIDVSGQADPVRQDLIVRVRDNGLGFSPERLAQIRALLEQDADRAVRSGSHIGLGNVSARIRLQYPGRPECGLRIESGEDGTCVTICMKTAPEQEAIS